MTDLRTNQEIIVDPACPLSESKIWELQAEFYQRLGAEAWNEKLPFFVTNSAFIAESYAELVVSALRDMVTLSQPEEPIFLLEIGTGIGRMANRLWSELHRKKQYFPELEKLEFKLILTDFTEANLDFWETHPNWGELIARGLVDMARLDPLKDKALVLRSTGLPLPEPVNPVFIFANYFLDSLPYDHFRMSNGRLERGLVELFRNQPEGPLQERFSWRDAETDEMPLARELLKRYRDRIPGVFSWPTAGLHCLENLARLVPRYVFIASDKGFVRPQDMIHYLDHEWVHHDGVISTEVNFHALAEYLVSNGGEALLTSHHSVDSLHTMVGLNFKGLGPNLGYSFFEKLDRANNLNTVNRMYSIIRPPKEDEPPGPEVLLNFIRLNLCDPRAFTLVANRLRGQLYELHRSQRVELLSLMSKTFAHYYPFPGEVKLPFWLGLLYLELNEPQQALACVQEVLARCGEHPSLLFLQGLALEDLGQPDSAADCYRRTLSLDPNFPDAAKRLQNLGK